MLTDSEFKIREILPEDNYALAELIRYNLKNHGLDIPGTVYFDKSLDNLYELYSGSDKCGYYVLRDCNDRVAGGIGFAEYSAVSGCAELQKLYLADFAKGAGLGYKLIKFIEAQMLKSGFNKSFLETHHKLEAAIHIYKKSGYAQIAPPKEAVHGAMDIFMCKDLCV